jgi:hypothetical protein
LWRMGGASLLRKEIQIKRISIKQCAVESSCLTSRSTPRHHVALGLATYGVQPVSSNVMPK